MAAFSDIPAIRWSSLPILAKQELKHRSTDKTGKDSAQKSAIQNVQRTKTVGTKQLTRTNDFRGSLVHQSMWDLLFILLYWYCLIECGQCSEPHMSAMPDDSPARGRRNFEQPAPICMSL
eukprot:3788916-Amphidinium_carterae.1